MPRNSYEHTLTAGFAAEAADAVPVPGDALAGPDSDALISAALTFWPQGAIWGSPDGQAVSLLSVLARFTRVIVSPFEWLYARAFRLALESSAQTLSEALDEWEADHGLPERCFTGEQTTPQRMAALRRKVAAEPLNHPEDFVRVAAEFGFTIEIEEPCIFECGYSECGGYHEAGGVAEEGYVVVRVREAAINYFECGASECGHDPLFSLGDAEQILCFLRQELPGWVIAVPDEWIVAAPLVEASGRPIVDIYGNPLLGRI